MPEDEPEVARAKARLILKALEEGLPHFCERMMCLCHRAAGKCACDEYDSKATTKGNTDV